MYEFNTSVMPALATFNRLGELSTNCPPLLTVYGAVMPFPVLRGGVNPAGMVKLTGELEACKRERLAARDPDPVMIAPERLPSMDCEFGTASRICGCAGMVTVIGVWLIGSVGAAARTGGAHAQLHTMVNAVQANARRRRCESVVASEVCMVIPWRSVANA